MIYIDGFLNPILADASEETHRIFAQKAVPNFKDHGATRVVEGWADDVRSIISRTSGERQ